MRLRQNPTFIGQGTIAELGKRLLKVIRYLNGEGLRVMLDALVIIFHREAEITGIAAERHVLVALGDEVEDVGRAFLGGFFGICGGGLEGFYSRSRKGAEANK